MLPQRLAELKPKKGDDREWFTFLCLGFDITLAKQLSRRRRSELVSTAMIDTLQGFVVIDHEHAMRRSRLREPVILGTVSDDGRHRILLDGHHRLYKARRLGKGLYPARVLTYEETWAVCFNRDLFRKTTDWRPDTVPSRRGAVKARV